MNKILSSILVGFALVIVRTHAQTGATRWSAGLNSAGQMPPQSNTGADMASLWGELALLGAGVPGPGGASPAQSGFSKNNIQPNPGPPDVANLFTSAVVPDQSGPVNTLPHPTPTAGSIKPTAIYGSGLRHGAANSVVNPSSNRLTQANSVFEKGTSNQVAMLHRPKRQGPGGRKNRHNTFSPGGPGGFKNRRNTIRRNPNRGKGRKNRNRNRSQRPNRGNQNAGGPGGAGNNVNPAMIQMIMQMLASGGGDMGMLAAMLGGGNLGAPVGPGTTAGGPNKQPGGLGAGILGPGAAGMPGLFGGNPSEIMAIQRGGVGFGPLVEPPGYNNPLGPNMPYIPGLDQREYHDMMGHGLPGQKLPLDLAKKFQYLRRIMSFDSAVDIIGDDWDRRKRMVQLQQIQKMAAAGTRGGRNGASSVVSMPMM